MAPTGDAPTLPAPGAAGVQGKKPSDERPDLVTPKTLFNGVAGSFGADMVNKLAERTSALKLDDLPAGGKENDMVKSSAVRSWSPAPDVLDKGKAKVEDKGNDDGYLSDDPDECQDLEVLNEIAAQAGFAITLLIPFAWNKEVPRTINTVGHLLLVWGKNLSENVRDTTRCQQLSVTYLSKKHFGRIQVVFQQEADANFVWSREVEHYMMNDKKLTLGRQHPENAGYLKERALHPEVIEVLLKGVRRWLQQRTPELISVLPLHQTTASLKLSVAAKIIMADPAISLTSVGGVREEWICVQEECGKAHGNNFK
ncbi:unnamed protein product [Closterium sp. Naga37s-1]|nr:unnamed protein product [Closterium sp. Naga37s-1]